MLLQIRCEPLFIRTTRNVSEQPHLLMSVCALVFISGRTFGLKPPAEQPEDVLVSEAEKLQREADSKNRGSVKFCSCTE